MKYQPVQRQELQVSPQRQDQEQSQGQVIDEGQSNQVKERHETPASSPYIEHLLLWCGISIGAYIGSYIRVGISYFKIWRIETNYTVMYAQILGCVIMGFMVKHKADNSRSARVIYTSLTSGLCGSITTFSTWHMEANKNFFLQWDTSWGNDIGSYNGGRLIEYLVSIWIGTVLPLMALRFGHHLSTLKSFTTGPTNKGYEGILVLLYFLFTMLVIILPSVVFPTWVHLTYTAIFGCLGAYLRYQLSMLNRHFKLFPVGTFIANIMGTWFIAILTVLSKYVVAYHDMNLLAILYGLQNGFCGCLTTISTFVNEIDTLPLRSAYKYGLISNIVAQIGVILIFNVYSATLITSSMIMPPPINVCNSFQMVCKELLDRSNCPTDYRTIIDCNGSDSLDNFVGNCTCGTFDAIERVSEVIIDGQLKSNVSSNIIPLWPVDSQGSLSPLEAIDFCLSFQNLCDHWFNRIACPGRQRQINGCDRGGIDTFLGICQCGLYDTTNDRVSELIIDLLLTRRYDLIKYNGFITIKPINLCIEYNRVCEVLLEHVQCPRPLRQIESCKNLSDYKTWKGTCKCGQSFDVASDRVAEDLMDALVRPWLPSLFVVSSNQNGYKTFDQCTSFNNICTFVMDQLSCPLELRRVAGCIGNKIEQFVGKCNCGQMKDITSTRTKEYLVDGTIAEFLWNNLTYIPPPQNPYTLLVSSNPFRPLLTPLTTLPI